MNGLRVVLIGHGEKLLGRTGAAGREGADGRCGGFEIIENGQQADRNRAAARFQHGLHLHFVIGRGGRNGEGGLIGMRLADFVGNLKEIQNHLQRRLEIAARAPAGTRLEETEKLIAKVEDFIKETIPKEDGTNDSRTVLHLPVKLAPIKLAVLPLNKKDGLPEIARELVDSCKSSFHCFYEEKDAIGRRYRRQDAIGTPYCITVDHQTLEDNTVTIRDRDTMKQERVSIASVRAKLIDACSINNILRKI